MQKHNAQTIWYREVMINAENLCTKCMYKCTNVTLKIETRSNVESATVARIINCSLHDVTDHVVI